jgi:RHS repeat-associated protein
VEYFSYDTNTGLKISHTDENSQVTTFKYDEMERLTNVYYPDTGSDAYVYTDSATPNPYFTFTKAITSSSNLVETGVVDGLGRKRHTEVNSDPAGTDYVDYSYDDRGRLYSVSNPHRSGTSSTDGTRYYSYDPLNRVQTVTEQDGSTISTSYSGSYATVTEEAGKVRKSYADGLGRMAGVWEDPSGLNYETDYSYDTLNNLTGVTQKGGASSSYWRTRTFEYDWLSRLTSATNPESGTTTYTYDANGNVVTKVAPQANQTGSSTTTTTYSYDARNRLSTKTYSDGTAGSYYYYDLTSTWGLSVSNPIGRLVAENTWSSGSSWITARGFSYDAMGRVVRTVYCTPAHCNDSPYPSPYWTATYSYDLAGDLTSLGYPSGRTITYGINAAKQTTSAVDSAYSINYATSAAYTPPGELASLANGSSLISTLFYNSRLQPCRISVKSTGSVPGSCTVSSDAGNVVDLTYNFNLGTADNGNVMKVSDNRTGMSGRNGNYTYDALNRIASAYTDATTGSYCWGETYQIDPWANLYTIAGKSTHSACTQESGLSLSGYINGSNQITLSGFGYDAAGNVTSTGTVSQKYDGENRICSVGGTNCTSGTTYTYDAKGQRIRKSSGTSYLYGVNDEVLTELNSSEAVSNEYIFFDGNRIARRDSSGNVDYYFSDHLGTARVVTNSSGTIQDDSDFYPYGGQRIISSASGNTYKFTGKERDSESGLDNFGARYNSSQYGRFMSPDPGPWIFLNPQSYNAYSYGLNNPLRYSDDSGMTAQDRVNEANLLASQNIDYVTGGKNPSCGLDCSGLVQNVFKADPDNTIPILDTVQSAATQATDLENSGQYSTDINQAQSGDAIFFSDPSSGKIVHTGIIVDIRNGKVYFVHAPKPGYKVGKNFVDIKKLKFGNEKFAGIGRPIEPVRSQTNTTNSSNPLSNAYNWLSNFVEQRFFNQQPQQQQEQVTTRIVDCQKEPNNPGCPQ